MPNDLKYMLAFHKILKVSLNKYFQPIYEKYGSFREAWLNLSAASFTQLPEKYRQQVLEERKTIEPQRLEEDYYRKGIKVLTRLEQNYPVSLLQISDIPCILYYCGQLSLLEQRALAIVGSRQASAYGLKQARLFAGELSSQGLVIVSGLARGIDAAAHWGTLEKAGATIAVLGSSLEQPYPLENLKLFQEIAEKGLVLSEYPLGTEPLGYNFPMRNRIISGLSQGVFVIEAQARSGSLITCNLALEQGKEVFALPGPITSANSIGPLQLIQDGAKLVIGTQDILAELGYQYQMTIYHQHKEIIREIEQGDKAVLDLIFWEPVSLEFIFTRSKLQREIVLSSLLVLEEKGLIKQLPGKYYVRV